MTPLEINRLCSWLISFRDGTTLSRGERDMLADVCNALDGYAKQSRALLEPEAPGPVPGDPQGAYLRGLSDAQRILAHEIAAVVRAVKTDASPLTPGASQ